MPSGVVLILIGDTVFVLGVVGVVAVVVFIFAIEADVKFFATADKDVDLRGL